MVQLTDEKKHLKPIAHAGKEMSAYVQSFDGWVKDQLKFSTLESFEKAGNMEALTQQLNTTQKDLSKALDNLAELQQREKMA